MKTFLMIAMVGVGLLCTACSCGQNCAPTYKPEVKSYDIDLTDGKVIAFPDSCCGAVK